MIEALCRCFSRGNAVDEDKLAQNYFLDAGAGVNGNILKSSSNSSQKASSLRVAPSAHSDYAQEGTRCSILPSANSGLLRLLPALTSLQGGWWGKLQDAVGVVTQHLSADHGCLYLLGPGDTATSVACSGRIVPAAEVGSRWSTVQGGIHNSPSGYHPLTCAAAMLLTAGKSNAKLKHKRLDSPHSSLIYRDLHPLQSSQSPALTGSDPDGKSSRKPTVSSSASARRALPADWRQLATDASCSCFVAVAVVAGGEPVAVLSLAARGSNRPASWTPEALLSVAALLSTLANQPQVSLAASALASLRCATTLSDLVQAVGEAAEEAAAAVAHVRGQARLAFVHKDLGTAAIFQYQAPHVGSMLAGGLSGIQNDHRASVSAVTSPLLSTPRRCSVEVKVLVTHHGSMGAGGVVAAGYGALGASRRASVDVPLGAGGPGGDYGHTMSADGCKRYSFTSQGHMPSRLNFSFSTPQASAAGVKCKGHTLPLAKTLLAEALEAGEQGAGGMCISDCNVYVQDTKAYPRDLVLSRTAAMPASLALATLGGPPKPAPVPAGPTAVRPVALPRSGSSAEAEAEPVLALYATYGSALPHALLQAVVQEMGQLLRALSPLIAVKLRNDLAPEWGYMTDQLQGVLPALYSRPMPRSSRLGSVELASDARSWGAEEHVAAAGPGAGAGPPLAPAAGASPRTRRCSVQEVGASPFTTDAAEAAGGDANTTASDIDPSVSPRAAPLRHLHSHPPRPEPAPQPGPMRVVSVVAGGGGAAAELQRGAPRSLSMARRRSLSDGPGYGTEEGGGVAGEGSSGGPRRSSVEPEFLDMKPRPGSGAPRPNPGQGQGAPRVLAAAAAAEPAGSRPHSYADGMVRPFRQLDLAGEGGGAGSSRSAAVARTASFRLEAAQAPRGSLRMAPLITSLHDRLRAAQAAQMAANGRAAGRGQDLSSLRLLQAVGRGGYGVVYRGTYYAAEVAVKVVFESQLAGGAGGGSGGLGSSSSNVVIHKQHLHDAIELVASLSMSHPNIVQVLTFFTDVRLHGPDGAPLPDSSPSDPALAACSESRPLSLQPQPSFLLESPAAGADVGPAAAGGGAMALVLEYCDRGSLCDAICGGFFFERVVPSGPPAAPGAKPKGYLALNMRAVYATLLEVALALHHMHSLHLVHCDLKPQNVLLKSSPRDPRGFSAKLSDFGLAKMMAHDEEGQLVIGEAVASGTITHVAPEILSGQKQLGAVVDIYAFGILMYQVLCGMRVYDGMSAQAIANAVVHRGMRPTLPAWVPPPYAALAQRCWAAQPGARPSAGELVRCLEGVMSGRRKGAAAVGAGAGGGGGGGGVQPAPPQQQVRR